MKIGLIIFRANPEQGGAERYTADLAAALAGRGHQVDLISTIFGSDIPGVQFIKVPCSSPTRTGRYRRFLRGMEEQVAKANYDIVHAMLPVLECDIYHPHSGLARETLKKSSRLNLKRRAFAKVEEQMLAPDRGTIVLCLSDYVKTMMLEHYPELDSRMVKLFNAVDLKRFDPEKHSAARAELRRKLKIAPDDVLALMIAQDFARKGLPLTLEAMAKLPEHVKLVVIGRQETKVYEKKARELGIGRRVIFAGPTDSPEDFYIAADFFVLPTKHDPCSLVVLESLAMGLPVVSTVFNGACEIMQNGVHGFVLPSATDVNALADAMRKLADTNFRSAARAACLALRPRLSFDHHVTELEKIYASKLAQKSTARTRE